MKKENKLMILAFINQILLVLIGVMIPITYYSKEPLCFYLGLFSFGLMLLWWFSLRYFNYVNKGGKK